MSRDGQEIPVEFSDTQGIIYVRPHAADDGVFLLAPGMMRFLLLDQFRNNLSVEKSYTDSTCE